MSSKIEQEFINAYDKHRDAIFRFCLFRIFDRERAEELSQEVFMRVWDYIRQGNLIRNIKAFLYTTARHMIINEIQRAKKHVSLEKLEADNADPSRLPSQLQQVETMHMFEVLKQIDETYREPILLFYIDGMSHKEIASLLGISESNVAVRIHRGIKIVHEKLGYG